MKRPLKVLFGRAITSFVGGFAKCNRRDVPTWVKLAIATSGSLRLCRVFSVLDRNVSGKPLQ
jgi:hypothetical protein